MRTKIERCTICKRILKGNIYNIGQDKLCERCHQKWNKEENKALLQYVDSLEERELEIRKCFSREVLNKEYKIKPHKWGEMQEIITKTRWGLEEHSWKGKCEVCGKITPGRHCWGSKGLKEKYSRYKHDFALNKIKDETLN